jgi:hypothetical protein
MEIKTPPPVDILTLGLGWVGTFLRPELDAQKLTHASTSRDGSNDTIPFTFDPEIIDIKAYARLPLAKTVVIIFPLNVSGSHEVMIRAYNLVHPDASKQTRWIQLGSTSAFDVSPDILKYISVCTIHEDQATTCVNGNTKESADQLQAPGEAVSSLPLWRDRHTPVDTTKARVLTEVELLNILKTSSCVLNLSGLWGGTRDMRHVVGRVAPTKSALAQKGSIHMIHGLDVARCIRAVHENFTAGRWLLTDMRVYDWWELVSAWGAREEGTATKEHVDWVRELILEGGIRALPRAPEQLGGKALDSREFWDAHKDLGGPLRAGLVKE